MPKVSNGKKKVKAPANAEKLKDKPYKPYKATDAVMDVVLKAIGAGFNISEACEYAGIDRGRFYEWKTRNPKAIKKIREMELKRKLESLENIKAHAKKDWRPDAWFLERKYPEEFALRGRTQDTKTEEHTYRFEIVKAKQ